MKDLALHILDITQNSITAKASQITIEITEEVINDLLTILIKDNGKGMSPEQVKKVSDPYFTSRKTRKVGMGIPLLMHNAKQADGSLNISSEQGVGTIVTAKFKHSHIDRPPLGDIAGVIKILIGANPEIDFVYIHKKEEKQFRLDSSEVRAVLEGLPINNYEVLNYICEMIRENLKLIDVS